MTGDGDLRSRLHNRLSMMAADDVGTLTRGLSNYHPISNHFFLDLACSSSTA